jgi:hypothetical protein
MPRAAQVVPKVCLRSWKTMGVVLLPRVPEVGSVERVVELIADDVVQQVLADLVREHEVVRADEVLAPAEAVERDHSLIGQREAARAMRLRRVLLEAAQRQAPTHVQDAVAEVDVLPAKRQQLALPQPGERSDGEHR